MFWEENNSAENWVKSDAWIDLAFAMECRQLPVDHLYALSQALHATIPDLMRQGIGVHEIHIAGSQNGWQRPDPELGQFLVPSRRTRMQLRTPTELATELQAELEGVTLDIDGNPLTLKSAKRKPLTAHPALYARHIALLDDEIDDEQRFLQRMAEELQQQGIQIRKALGGKTTYLKQKSTQLPTRSLMLADLKPVEAIKLLHNGLGTNHDMGCGLFLPMKGIQHLDPDMTQ